MDRQKIPTAQRRWLVAELAAWQADGLVSADQAARIRDRYETDAEAGQRHQSLASFALLGLAAFVFAAAVLLLIGYNWDAMPRAAKLAVVVAVVLATHAAGLYLRFKAGATMLSEVVLFLGCLLYGAGIWLVAQAFHLDAHYPDGFWWWAVGVLPFALCLDSLLCHLLFVVLMATWAGLEVLGFPHLSPWGPFGWGRWPNAAYSLPLLALPGVLWAYRRPSPTGLSLYVPLVAWWVFLQSVAWGTGHWTVFWVAFLGAVLLVLAEAHRPDDAMAIPYRVWGAVATAGALLPLSSAYFWEYQQHVAEFGQPTERSLAAALTTEAIAAGVLLGLAAFVLARGLRLRAGGPDGRRPWYPVGLAVGLVALAAWAAALPTSALGWLVPVVAGNAAMIGLALYLIRIGARDERVRPFAAGVAYLVLWACVRYVDLFHAAGGMLGAAALFFLVGAGLVVVARFWARARAARDDGAAPPATAAPAVGPAWLEGLTAWLAARRRPILIAAVAFNGLVLGGMIAVEATPLVLGETIRLRVEPVDPRDLMRGDYVILSYDATRVATDALRVEGRRGNDRGLAEDQPVYVTLEPEPDGVHWRATGASLERPAGGKFLRGKVSHSWPPVTFGIEAFYVQEGTGLDWERHRNQRTLSADVALTSWGTARLRGLVATEPPP